MPTTSSGSSAADAADAADAVDAAGPGPRFAAVAVDVEPFHLDRPFDYALPDDADPPVRVGSLVEVVFAGRRRRGVVLALHDEPRVDVARVRALRRALGPHAWVTPAEAELARWAADRWGGTLADVLRHALPRRVKAVEAAAAGAGWFPTAPRAAPAPLDRAAVPAGWATLDGGTALWGATAAGARASVFLRPAPDEDVAARLCELVRATVAAGRDTLVVAPDVGSRIAHELVATLVAELPDGAVVDRRGTTGDRARYRDWLACRTGRGRVLVGERGVALWPLHDLGLGVVLDEANPALKERRSPRHHAREVVLERARRAGGVGVLVGTVPSAAAWRLLAARRLRVVRADRVRERRAAPVVRPVPGGRTSRLQRSSVRALGAALDAGVHGVVLATLRGEGRALLCAGCDLLLRCPTCDRTPRPAGADVACEGCGWSSRRDRLRCSDCRGQRFRPLVAGAHQLGEELHRSFPEATVAVLEGYDQPAPPPPSLLVVTRGSVMDRAPGPVGCVVLPGFDGLLRRPELDAAEDALRLATRLADWTVQEPGPLRDARDAPGPPATPRGSRRVDRTVLVQTGEEDHHAVQALVARDPGAFWRVEAAVREELRLPPSGRLVRLSVPGDGEAQADAVSDAVAPPDRVLGPTADGAGRSSLLVKTSDVARTLAALRPLREQWSRGSEDVRVDVDPVDVR